ncbi:MAG: serine hydrolase domain-containing protein [Thermoanaerobaculia bacterium]
MSGPDAVRSLLEEGVDRGFFPGAAAVVSGESGPLVQWDIGEARTHPPEERRAVLPDTLWDLASLTKPLAGTALLMALAQDRSLILDDPLSRFHDLFKKMKFSGVTLRHLLTHTGGLQAWYPCYVGGEGRGAYRRTLADLDSIAAPGREVHYSCLGFLLLAEVVERVGGAELDLQLRDRVTAPLGLADDLIFFPQAKDLSRAAGGERDDATERKMVAERHLRYHGFRSGFVNGEANDGNAYHRAGGVSLNAGLFGTAAAVAELGRAWLVRNPRLLSETSIADATRLATEGLAEARGLGWELASSPESAAEALSPESFGHTGFTGSSIFVDPERKRVFVLLTNRLHPDARSVDIKDFRSRFHRAAAEI